jgi:hypothetical protein
MADLIENVFTYNLTDSSLVVEGMRKLCVYCTSETSGSIVGHLKYKNLDSEAVAITQDSSFVITSEQNTIGRMTITAPAGCTLIIVLMQ